MENQSQTIPQASVAAQLDEMRAQFARLDTELAALRSAMEIYRLVVDESSDPIFLFGRDGTYRFANRAFAEGVNRPVEEITGRRIWDVFSQEEADKRYSVVKWVFENGLTREIEVRVPRADGDRFYLTTARPVMDIDGQVAAVVCISKEITERKRMEEELRQLSIIDLLTGVYNRNFFETEVERIQHSRLYPVSIVMVDIDNLKVVNDTAGHAAGDELIRCAARVLKQTFRAEDIIARFGGDEFVVLLPETGEEAAESAVSRVRAAAAAVSVEHFSLSFGWATGHKGDWLHDVMRRADDAMYLEKKKVSRRMKRTAARQKD